MTTLHTVPLWGLNESGICNCPKGHSCGESAGRHPISSGWREEHTETPVREFCQELKSLDQVGQIPSYGILCGEPNNIAVLDIDPRNKGWETWEEWGVPMDLTVTEAVITPRGGYHIYFKYDSIPEELRRSRKIGPGMDFISDGKYVVGPGCSQSNGNRYISQSPSGHRSFTPAIDGKGLRSIKAPQWLIDKLKEANRVEQNKTTDQKFEIAPLTEAASLLQWIDGTGYNEWIMVGMGLHKTYEGSDEALEQWIEWSKKFPSFQDEGDCTSHWSSFGKRGGAQVGYGTLVWLALEGGMPRKKPEEGGAEPVRSLTDQQIALLERMKWERKYSGPYEDYDSGFPGFGFGLMKELAELMLKHAPQPDPLIALAGALGYFAAFFSRRWRWGGMDTKMYLIVAAPSGGGKGVIEQIVNIIHKYTGMSRTLRGEPIRSDSGLLAMLAEYVRRLTITDEIGDWFMALKISKRSGGHAFQTEAVLKTAYTSDSLSLGGTAKRRAATVFDPALTIIGTTTRGALENALTAAQFEGGLMGRFMFAIKPDEDALSMPVAVDMQSRDKDLREFSTKLFEVNAKHIEELREIVKATPPPPNQDQPAEDAKELLKKTPKMVLNEDIDFDDDLEGAFNISPMDMMPAAHLEAADIHASWIDCPSEKAADEMMENIQKHVIEWRNKGAGFNELLWSFWNRFPLQVRKVALIAALCDNPWQPRIHIGHVKWAFSLCLFFYNRCNHTLFMPIAKRNKEEENIKYGKITPPVIRKVCAELLNRYPGGGEAPEIKRSAILRTIGNDYPGEKMKIVECLTDQGILEWIPGSVPIQIKLRKDEIAKYFLNNPDDEDEATTDNKETQNDAGTGRNFE